VNEREISRVGDILQLQAMKATYCDTVDACTKDGGKAAARLAELLTEDVHADYGMGPLNGRKAVVEFLVGTIVATNESIWHAIHTPRIDVSGDTATGHWTLIVRMKRKESTTFDTLYGRYLDEFRRTQQGWRISSVRFIQES
jgi:ketosteroid isomerase-like protein